MASVLATLPFSLRQLQYIVAVADHGGFRRAADACHVAQPSLSAQVARAERALGVRIFERARGGVRVVPGARALVDRARALLVGAHDLAQKARLETDPFAETIRIGVIPTVCPYILPDVAPALTRQFPRLTIVWSEERTRTLVRRLEEGALDAVLVAAGDETTHLDQAELARDPFVLAAAPGQALVRRGTPLPAGALLGAKVLLLEDGHCFRDQALALCDAAGAVEGGFRATSLSTLVQMVSANKGITLLPSLALPVENRRAQLRIRPFARGGPSRTLVLAWRRGSALHAVVEAVAAGMRAALGAVQKPRT